MASSLKIPRKNTACNIPRLHESIYQASKATRTRTFAHWRGKLVSFIHLTQLTHVSHASHCVCEICNNPICAKPISKLSQDHISLSQPDCSWLSRAECEKPVLDNPTSTSAIEDMHKELKPYSVSYIFTSSGNAHSHYPPVYGKVLSWGVREAPPITSSHMHCNMHLLEQSLTGVNTKDCSRFFSTNQKLRWRTPKCMMVRLLISC